jgi:hypothetical protein
LSINKYNNLILTYSNNEYEKYLEEVGLKQITLEQLASEKREKLNDDPTWEHQLRQE